MSSFSFQKDFRIFIIKIPLEDCISTSVTNLLIFRTIKCYIIKSEVVVTDG